jgi:hypothetical protein
MEEEEEEEEEETRTRGNDVCCRAVRLDTMMLSLPNPRTTCIALSLFHSLSLSPSNIIIVQPLRSAV